MEERNYKVYIHRNKINNKVYIGITSIRPKRRWCNGYGYISQILFYNAIKKYGWDNFEHEILFDNLTKDEAEQKEIELIAKYNSNSRDFGYNIENGGNTSGKYSKERKRQIMRSQPNRKIVEQIDIESNNVINVFDSLNEAARFVGGDYTNIRSVCNGTRKSAYGYKWQYKDNRIDFKPKKRRDKSVYQIDLNTGKILNTFGSINKAARYIGCSAGDISSACNGKYKKSHGYGWRYAN